MGPGSALIHTRRLARDYEWLPETLAGLHVVAFACPMLRHAANLATVDNSLWVGKRLQLVAFSQKRFQLAGGEINPLAETHLRVVQPRKRGVHERHHACSGR